MTTEQESFISNLHISGIAQIPFKRVPMLEQIANAPVSLYNCISWLELSLIDSGGFIRLLNSYQPLFLNRLLV